jgi:hypothetical protein
MLWAFPMARASSIAASSASPLRVSPPRSTLTQACSIDALGTKAGCPVAVAIATTRSVRACASSKRSSCSSAPAR